MQRLKFLLMLALLSGRDAAPRNPKIVGVFDNQSLGEIFSQVLSALEPETEYDIFVIGQDSTQKNSLAEYLCNTGDILFVYSVLSLPPSLHISILSSISMVLAVPVFVYDATTTPMHVRWLQDDLLYYMNSKTGDEGKAIADIISTYGFPRVDILVQSEYENDTVHNWVKELVIEGHEEETIELVFSAEDSANSLLIQLQNSISTREVNTQLTSPLMQDQHDVSLEVILLHCDPDTSRKIMRGAELLFHDKQIIWILSPAAAGDPDLFHSLKSDVVTVSWPALDQQLMLDAISFIYHKIISSYRQLPLTATSCRDGGATLRDILQWKRFIRDAELADAASLNYYRYNMNIKLYDQIDWINIKHVISNNSLPISSLAGYLRRNVTQREMYTVVTVLDKPFAMEVSPVAFDGGEHCPTPSIPCLKIPESVIASFGYSSDVVKNIFQDYYHNKQNPLRPYHKACCEGLCIDLLKSLSAELQFDYQLYIVPDGEWGAFDVAKDSWSGLVKELLDGRADMVVGPFSITAARSAVISYSSPFYHSGFSLMSIRRQNYDTKWFSYLNPYPTTAWALIILAACFTFLILGFFEWHNPRRMKENQSYTLGSAILTVFSLMSGNTISSKSPISWPGKWMQNVWGFFSIIYLSVYTANLTSSITDSMSICSFSNIHEEKLKKVQVAAPTNGAIEQYIKLIEPRLYENMRSHKIKTIAEGVSQLRDGRLDVWMHDTPVIDYTIATEDDNCTLKRLLTFAVDSYGIGFPRDGMTDIKSSIDSKLVEYQMSGYIEKLQDVYFSSDQQCHDHPGDPDIMLELRNAAGLFLTLTTFVVICFLLIGLEHLAYQYMVPYGRRKPVSSFWRSKGLMFFSQRLHRAVEMDGVKGSSVFTQFGRSFIQLLRFFTVDEFVKKKRTASTILKLSFKREAARKMDFYEVVCQVYEREKNQPLSSIFYMKERKRKEEVHMKHWLKSSVSGLKQSECNPTASLKLERRFVTSGAMKRPKTVNFHGKTESEIGEIPLQGVCLKHIISQGSQSFLNSDLSEQTTHSSANSDGPGRYSRVNEETSFGMQP